MRRCRCQICRTQRREDRAAWAVGRWLVLFALLWGALVGVVEIARGDTAADVGTGFTSSNPAGQVSGGQLTLDDANAHTSPAANRMKLRPNASLGTAATCANTGTAGWLTLLDLDNTATTDPAFCLGTSMLFDIPDTGADVIANAQILIGTGAGTGQYVAISGDVAVDNTGATTIQANAVALGADTTGNYAAGDAEAGNATGLACTDCVALSTETTGNYVASVATSSPLTGGATGTEGATLTLGCQAASGAQAGCLSSTDWTTFNGKLSAEVDGSTTNEINTVVGDSGTATDALAVTVAGGAGITTSSSSSTDTVTVATASTEASFLTDGGATDLTCGSSNQGKLQVLDDGQLQWCDGATTSTLRRAAFANSSGVATSASALAANPSDCSANQFANAIAASGDLTCAALTDADIPNSITVTLAATATALAANGANCSAGQYPLGVDASGAVESCTADDDVPESGDFGNLTGGAGITVTSGTIATASNEADFLASGALTCGAATQGKAQVHTTPLQYCDNAGTPTLRYAAYGSSTGVATSATALAANGANCSAGSYPLGVDASGAAESCTTDDDVPEVGDFGALTFAQVGAGTNANALVVGAGGSLGTSGGGTISATTAGALAANPSDCSANQFATTIAASGNLTCASISDADVPDTITASNYLPLAGGTLTGQLVTDNLGVEFEESDTNPTCAAGNYTIFADLSETKLKKCVNGTASDLSAVSFDAITSGTNTSATMTVGSGASLVATNGVLRLPNATTAMTTCTVGDVKQDTDAAAGQRVQLCIATDTPTGIDNPFGSQINTSEMENTLSFSSAQVLDLATNDADLRLAQTASNGTNEGSFYIDNTTNEPEWYSGGALNKLENYARLTGRSGGQTLLGGNTSDTSDNQALVLAASGAGADTRGASLTLYGNESSGHGDALLVLGDDSGGGAFAVYANNANAGVFGAADFAVEYDGNVCIQEPATSVTGCSRTLGIGGTAARNVGMERHTTSNTAGNGLTINAGGATSGATDKDGGTLTLEPGTPTGQGKGYVIIHSPTRATATGTSDQAQVDRIVVGGKRTLTNSSATAVLNATAASGSAIAGIIHYAIEVTNGTDYQAEAGQVHYTAANKAGTLTSNVTETAATTQTLTGASTLTSVWSIGTANPVVVSVNANSSLTPSTGYPRITFWVENLTDQAVAPQ